MSRLRSLLFLILLPILAWVLQRIMVFKAIGRAYDRNSMFDASECIHRWLLIHQLSIAFVFFLTGNLFFSIASYFDRISFLSWLFFSWLLLFFYTFFFYIFWVFLHFLLLLESIKSRCVSLSLDPFFWRKGITDNVFPFNSGLMVFFPLNQFDCIIWPEII